ncbi:MAG: hypothetical protein ABSF95_08855 [Verrucomicrobiota bacterium]|jgi:hypothetical protein
MKSRGIRRICCRTGTGRTVAHLLAGFLSLELVAGLSQATDATPPRTGERVLVANDTCPDVTWGWTEEQTRQAFADLVRSHLDEMQRTDNGPPESRDHFNLATTQEALDFVARYPARKEELARRIREGRVCVSPFLCNSLWGFQSVEGALRTLYPARRLEREWNIRLEVAEHIELPSLPWGMASLLAGCGVRWVSNPFLDYDCAFKALRNPPLFRWAGPDGNEVRVIMDAWASSRANYAQGALLLREPARIINEWWPHYRQLGAAYPVPTILASGTHSDISPESWKQTRGFSEALRQYNAAGTNPVRLVNGTLAQFCAEVDAVEASSPFLPVLRGCFGHSWELWPVSLARTVAELRAQERCYVAAESLVALAVLEHRGLTAATRANREQAEWFWAMLSDHAWNGTDLKNKRHNAELRQRWAEGLGAISRGLTQQAWKGLGLREDERFITVFNPLSFTNDVLVVCGAPPRVRGIAGSGQVIPAQFDEGENGRRVTFVAKGIPPFGFREFVFTPKAPVPKSVPFKASAAEIEGSFYKLGVAGDGSGIASLVHKGTGQELVHPAGKRILGQAVFFDGTEHRFERTAIAVAASGPVFASLRISGDLGPIRVTNDIILYAELDRVDIDVQLEKPPSTNEQRLLHFFPLGGAPRDCHLETTGAVICPAPQPEGDLLPGADPRRFAVQGFLDVSPAHTRAGVTLSPIDAFMLRFDQGAPAFEPLGNDQNWKEVTQDQAGVRHFRFRYRLRAHASGYDNAAAMAWSRSVQAPVVYAKGRLPGRWLNRPLLYINPERAVVTCLKPVDDPRSTGLLVRVWETAGLSAPMRLVIPEARRAMPTDLLERPRGPFHPVRSGMELFPRPHGFMAVQWER